MIELEPGYEAGSAIALNMLFKRKMENNLSKEDSEKNLSQNIVQVCSIDTIVPNEDSFSFDGSSGTGLALTADGWILTAYHNIERFAHKMLEMRPPKPKDDEFPSWLSEIRDHYCVIDQEDNRYAIDTSCWWGNREHDLVLIKALNNNKPAPIKFRFAERYLKRGEEIKLFGLDRGKLFNQFGSVVDPDYVSSIRDEITGELQKYPSRYLTDAYSIPGFSGGIFTDSDGAFAGMSQSGVTIIDTDRGRAAGTRSPEIIEFVRSCAYELGIKELEKLLDQ